jgi:hypothetical protein
VRQREGLRGTLSSKSTVGDEKEMQCRNKREYEARWG